MASFSPAIGRDFSSNEVSLGLLSFLVWYAQGAELRRARHPYSDDYIGLPNVSGRNAALEFMVDGLATAGVVEPLKRHFRSFRPEIERGLGERRTGPGDPGYADWHDCLTRVMILTTRSMAYAFCEGRLPTTRQSLEMGLPGTLDLAESLVAEWLPAPTAKLLRSRTMATVKAF